MFDFHSVKNSTRVVITGINAKDRICSELRSYMYGYSISGALG